MKRIALWAGRTFSRAVQTIIIGALAIALIAIPFATANYFATQGSGTTFASVVISSVHYFAQVICDATVGQSQCQAVDSSGNAHMDAPTGSNLSNLIAAAAPCLNATAYNTNSYSNGGTNPLNCDLKGNLYVDIGSNGLGTTNNPLYSAITSTIGLPTGASTSANQILGSSYGNAANWVTGKSTLVTTTATTTILAAPVSNKLYVTDVECFNSGTTSSVVTFNDPAATPFYNPSGSGVVKTFSTPLALTATTAFTFAPGSASTSQWCSAQGYNAP